MTAGYTYSESGLAVLHMVVRRMPTTLNKKIKHTAGILKDLFERLVLPNLLDNQRDRFCNQS